MCGLLWARREQEREARRAEISAQLRSAFSDGRAPSGRNDRERRRREDTTARREERRAEEREAELRRRVPSPASNCTLA